MDFFDFSHSTSILPDFAGLCIPRISGKHPDRLLPSFELFFVRSGCLHIEEEGHPFSVGKNQTLLLWPGRRHRGLKEFGYDLQFYWIHFRVKSGSESSLGIRVPQLAQPARPECLSELFHRYLSDQESGLLTVEEASCLLSLILLEVRRGVEDHPPENPMLAEKARLFIEENFHQGIHSSGIAKALGCNPNYLASLYRRTFGLTLSHAIHQKQVYEARSLLRDSSRNMDQIATACGFSDRRYFRRVFTALQGIGPRAYRKLYSHMHVKSR